MAGELFPTRQGTLQTQELLKRLQRFADTSDVQRVQRHTAEQVAGVLAQAIKQLVADQSVNHIYTEAAISRHGFIAQVDLLSRVGGLSEDGRALLEQTLAELVGNYTRSQQAMLDRTTQNLDSVLKEPVITEAPTRSFWDWLLDW